MKNERYESKIAAEEAGEHPSGRSDGLPKGAPRRAGMKSVLVRAGIAGSIFFMFLIFINHDPPAVAAAWAIGIAILMMPLGMLLDRMSHKMAMKRWMKQTGRS